MTGDKSSRLVVAVMGGGANGYDAAVSLRAHNIETFVLTSRALTDGKYPGSVLRCPGPEESGALATFLNGTVAPGNQVVLLPTSEAFALFLARNRGRLEERFLYLIADASLIEATDNKMLFHELCAKNGIPCPKTQVVRNQRELESSLGEVSFPVVVKPFRSRDWPASVGYKVTVVNEIEALRAVVLEAMSHACEVIVQDMIPGGAQTDVVAGGLYDRNGMPLKLYVAQKILQNPLDVGAGCYAKLMWNPQVADLCNRFAERTGYRGLVDMDIKYDPRDQTYKMIEVNPRQGMCHRISSDGRWDLLSFYVHWLSGQEVAAGDYQVHEDGRTWIYPHAHLCSRIEERGLLRGTLQWLREMRHTPLRCAWALRDLRRCWRYFRVVVGHVRSLSLGTLLFGRTLLPSGEPAVMVREPPVEHAAVSEKVA
jgi:D-aspartate ligase